MGRPASHPIVQGPSRREHPRMAFSSPLNLSRQDKLDVLRFLDEFRLWRSLDDERCCMRCHETITGRQILVSERNGTRGRMRLQCPTPGCVSSPSEWVYANPVLFAASEIPSSGSWHQDDYPAPTKCGQSTSRGRVTTDAVSLTWFQSAIARFPVLQRLVAVLHAIHRVSEKLIGFFRIFDSGSRLKTSLQR